MESKSKFSSAIKFAFADLLLLPLYPSKSISSIKLSYSGSTVTCLMSAERFANVLLMFAICESRLAKICCLTDSAVRVLSLICFWRNSCSAIVFVTTRFAMSVAILSLRPISLTAGWLPPKKKSSRLIRPPVRPSSLILRLKP